MTHIKDGSGKYLSNISIERVDNSLGYVKENIALVCLACNMMKYTLDLKELLNWCKMITTTQRGFTMTIKGQIINAKEG
jgi:hypothetical protein